MVFLYRTEIFNRAICDRFVHFLLYAKKVKTNRIQGWIYFCEYYLLPDNFLYVCHADRIKNSQQHKDSSVKRSFRPIDKDKPFVVDLSIEISNYMQRKKGKKQIEFKVG